MVYGIDVSYAQKLVDWAAVKRARGFTFTRKTGVPIKVDEPIAFAMIKVSGGEIGHPFTDPQFRRNWNGAGEAGLPRGAYHFMNGTLPGPAQAEWFLNALNEAGGLTDQDLLPVVDVEWPADRPTSFSLAELGKYIDRVEAALNAPCMIYTGGWYWDPIGGSKARFSENPLWLAAYTAKQPAPPTPWEETAMWQFAATGKLAGIERPVDLNRAETLDGLRKTDQRDTD